MNPRDYVAAVNALAAAAGALADLDPADLPAALAADSVAALAHAARLADNALALVTGRVAASGVWADDGAGSAASWVAARTGSSHREAAARLAAAHVTAEHPEFAASFRVGATGVAHLAHVDRTLRGPGPVKAERRHHFPHYAPALSRVASETDSGDFARALKEWTDAVDHAPSNRELDAISSRFLSFSEYGDTCLIEGSLPLIEGRLLRRRLEALVDAHFRNPGVARLDDRWRADPPPSSTGRCSDAEVPDAEVPDTGVPDSEVTDTGVPDAGDDPAAPVRGDEGLAAAGGDTTTRRSALMLDALLAFVDIAEAHPGAMPMVDGQPPQVIVIVPAERLARRPLADPRPRPLTGGWIGADSDHARSARPGSARPGSAPPNADHPPSTAPPGGRAGSLVPPALATTSGESTPVDDATARWAACGHAEIRRLVLAPDGVVTDLGRTARVAGRDLRLQVALRDRWCRHPGCRVPALRCQAHHLIHWADGGTTSLPNLFALCHRHHRLHHQWQAAGQLTVTGTPDGDLDFFNGAVHLGTTRPQPVHRLPRPGPPTEAGPDTRHGGG